MADPVLNLGLGIDDKQLIEGLRRAGFEIRKMEKGVSKSAAGASVALTNLARVAQDAPFGFIAIANNLDPLVQSLGSLSKTSGGVGGALKALGGALIGPAGLALAFASVSSAVTFAIKEYGSLGAAISALVGSNSSLSQSIAQADKSYQKFNETARTAADIANEESIQSSAQITRIRTLVDVINNSNESYSRRTAALEQLKSVNKEHFGDLDLEKMKVGDLEKAYVGYINKIIAAAKAKGFEEELSKTNLELDKQQKLLGKLVDERGKARERLQQLAQQAPTEAIGGAPILQSLFDPNLEKSVQKQIGVVNELFNRVQELETGIRETTIATLDFSKTQTKLSDSAKAAAKAQAALARELKKQNEEFKKFQEGFNFNAPQQFFQDLILIEDQLKDFAPEIEIKTFPFNPIDLINAQLRQEELDKATAKYNDRILGLVGTFNDLLAPAINTIFGALENGQNVFKALGQSLKALVVQLVATVAKAAILAAILSLIPGAGAALGVAGSVAGAGGNFLGLFKNFLPGLGGGGIGRAAAPTFSGGAGINAGGLQLAGQVVFVQRGPDLVGVLNQGNARIGRVG